MISENQNKNKPLLLGAISGDGSSRVPVWFMRQAGRYLPEYNRLRGAMSFLDLCSNVDAAVSVSMQPYERFAVDGIIMFSDILTPIHGAGIPLHFEEKKGPVIEKIFEKESDIALLDKFSAVRDCGYVSRILKTLRARIDAMQGEKPALIGFAGAPFTLASYLIEGGTSKKFEKTKAFVFGHSDFFHRLSGRLADMAVEYLKMQIDAGADVVQISDSWGGILGGVDYEEFSAQYTGRIIKELKHYSKKPVILFVGNSAHLLRETAAQKPDVISLDWRVPPQDAFSLIPPEIALQGNMDPLVLYGNTDAVKRKTMQTLESFSKRKNWIFNLGHGIHPASPIENVEMMIRTVKEFRRS